MIKIYIPFLILFSTSSFALDIRSSAEDTNDQGESSIIHSDEEKWDAQQEDLEKQSELENQIQEMKNRGDEARANVARIRAKQLEFARKSNLSREQLEAMGYPIPDEIEATTSSGAEATSKVEEQPAKNRKSWFDQ